MRAQVRKRKPGGDWSLAHGGMIFDEKAQARLIKNYQAHGYEAEIVEVPVSARNQMFW